MNKPNRKEDLELLITRGHYAKVWIEKDHWLVIFDLKNGDEVLHAETSVYDPQIARELILQGVFDYFIK